MIDLRSDTVTRPSEAMLAAMTRAETGDDVWGDDPTVLRLQARMAEEAGKEAGLFFPSGTQSNLAALMAHCARGDEYIVGQAAHTYKYEGGGAAVLGSIQPQPLDNADDGTIALERIAAAIKPLDDHFARTRLLAARCCRPITLRRPRSSPTSAGSPRTSTVRAGTTRRSPRASH